MKSAQESSLSTQNSQNELNVFDFFDTAKKSLVLKWLTPKDVSKKIPFAAYLKIYLTIVFVSWVLPFIIVAVTQPSLIRGSEFLILPFLLDVNVAMISVISAPLLLILLVHERGQVAETLSDLYRMKVIVLEDEEAKRFIDKWENLFAQGNIWAQIVGLLVSGLAIFINVFGGPNTNYYGKLWQTYNPLFLGHNLAGWFYLIFQIGLFFFIAGQVAVREIYVVKLFFDLTRVCKLDIKPLHPDRVGGLKSIAALGLNYQFAVALLGVNLGTMVITSRIIGVGEQTELIVAALMFYCLIAPLVFVGPLIPFRIHMLKSKQDMLLRISHRFEYQIEDTLEKVDIGKLESKEIDRINNLNELYNIVNKFPEWPFDITTLQKFSSVFISPLIPLILSWVFTIWLAPR